MAGAAVQGRVGPQQRKPILVLVDLLGGNLPTFHAVTLLTIRTELAFMNVSVAISALVTHVGEYRFDVALCAGHSLMQAPQRIASLVMVELRHIADRLPSAQGVAVLARNIERAVGTPGVGIGLRLPHRRQNVDHQQEHEKQLTPDRRRQRKTACIGFDCPTLEKVVRQMNEATHPWMRVRLQLVVQ